MICHFNSIRTRVLPAFVCAALGLVCTSVARGQQRTDLSQLIKQVRPSVALIEVIEKGQRISNGSGFVVDADGMIATNYHVIEGAKEIRVSFPAEKDNKFYPATGFVGYYQKKDMALIKIDSKGKKLRALPLAKELPSPGEMVVAIGAPLGLSDTVTDGIVSAVRTGKELSQMLMRGGRDSYGKDLGYETDATWIQTSAPISPGNSGGPLLNSRGEVVGINTFVSNLGQNLNFSISTTHLQKFIETWGKNVQSFANLPPPRENRRLNLGDAKVTFELWENLNRSKNELDEDIENCEKKFQKLPPVDHRNPMKGMNIRNRKIADQFKRMAESYNDYSSKISGYDNKGADTDLIGLVVADTVIAKKLSDACKEVSNASSSGGGSLDWEAALSGIKRIGGELDIKRELLRVNLGLKYSKSFPTQAETAENDKKKAKEKKIPEESTAESTSPGKDRSQLRLWTDITGKFQIKAKCLGVENGVVKLEKSDGTVIPVPLDKLSEADKRFLESTE